MPKQILHLQELIEYCNAVQKGEIIACKRHTWACLRFLRDVKRSQDNDPTFPHIFDESKADRFFQWMHFFKHRKGVLKGQHILPGIEHKFVFGNVYGWYNKNTGYRRFNKMYFQVARKNAKSQYLSGVGSYELIALDPSGEEVAEVYCAATKTEQAKIVYDETVAMLNSCPDLKKTYAVAYGRITRTKNGAVMRPLSEEDRKTGDGYNPQCGIIDEYHAHETSEMYDILDSGMGARTQPLLAIITTAGFDLNNPCYKVEYDLVTKLLDPDNPFELDSYFADVYELDKNETSETMLVNGREVAPGKLIDDINDEKVWVKANPVICSYPEGVEYLRKKLAEAVNAPDKMRNFLTKHMNVWVNETAFAYINLNKWALCQVKEAPESLDVCYVGIDLSSKIDLTSVAFEFLYKKDGVAYYHVFSQSFMPRERYIERMEKDRVRYDLWAQAGFLTLIEGATIDYETIYDYIIDTARGRGWTIAQICLDPWGAGQISNRLIDDGLEVVEVIQGMRTLSEPTKHFREMAYSGRVSYLNSPVLTWALGNAVTRQDDKGNIQLDKAKSKLRIDPAAALMNAHVRAMLHEFKNENGRVFFV